MAHRHTIGITFTGPDVEVKGGHYHRIPGGGKTSTNPEGPRHTHTAPGGKKTSGPIPLPGGDDDHNGSHHTKKARKKKKKKNNY